MARSPRMKKVNRRQDRKDARNALRGGNVRTGRRMGTARARGRGAPLLDD